MSDNSTTKPNKNIHDNSINTNDRKNVQKEYAIVMLCMLKNHYVFGACIAAFTHKIIMTQNNIKNIDLAIMCDGLIYTKYKSLLSCYFDRVEKITLDKFGLSKKYYFTKRWISKYEWINYSTNKWQCLKLVDYKKILFIDIDILPVSNKFYEIFSQNTPSFSNHYVVNNKLILDDKTKDSKFFEKVYDPLKEISSYETYAKMKKIQTLNGGLVLLEPNIQVYDKYKDFIDKTFFGGVFSTMVSGPDELSLFYFYTKIHNEKIFYKIPKIYQVTPWDDPKEYIKSALSYNFVSFVKPWLKPKFLLWPEERLWRDIYDIIPFKKELSDLLKESLLIGFDMYLKDSSGFMNKYVKSHPELIDFISNDGNNDNERFKRIIAKEKSFEFRLERPKETYGLIELKSKSNTKSLKKCLVNNNNTQSYKVSENDYFFIDQ